MDETADQNVTRCYRTIDLLENLKIKVVLCKVADRRVPLSRLNHGSALSLQLRNERSSLNTGTHALLPHPEELIVRWQKKVMSPKELAEHSANPKKSKLKSREYLHHAVPDEEAENIHTNSKSEGGMFLFTYIDSDEYTDPEDVHRAMTTSANEELSEMAKRALTLTKSLTGPLVGAPGYHDFDSQHTGVSDRPIHLYKPLQDSKFTEMHIMAYIYSEESDGKILRDDLYMKGYEKRLCTIKCYDNGLVMMTPGLSTNDIHYQFQINEDVFQYKLELMSKELDAADEEKEWKIYKEFYDRRLQTKQAHLPSTFQRPPSAPGLRVVLMGEIASASGFTGHSVYIHYLVDLTEGWTVEGGQLPLLSAFTQCSSGYYQAETGVWEARFSFPVEVELISVQGYNHTAWPKIFFEVCSMDNWDRSLVLGYGYVDIPKEPGCYDLNVTTWKPLVSPTNQLKSILVGGSAELDDITYDYIPFGHRGPKLIKYGFQTESSGTINFKMNLIHQRGTLTSTVEADSLRDTNPTQFLKNNAHSISEALQRAKSRLEMIRQNKKNE
ncbi:hypothetical protein BCR33DRAFT_762970 [Rhizoclosmatium globosum]|uniref:Meckel syndrome type 1 protein n=1 Tax=Rhizoclosmatium globosum TaxID=329046 RepID=A0A1Y2CS29_9FUNG|nr:hypothetical protein BCR33DRAFT_762970 [Rhizoclosmatium globosum]|eukprot:ORY49870.1 hypothetical protein BCR33DRAFT_762970 [Rhizoclosmatium globosum]